MCLVMKCITTYVNLNALTTHHSVPVREILCQTIVHVLLCSGIGERMCLHRERERVVVLYRIFV